MNRNPCITFLLFFYLLFLLLPSLNLAHKPHPHGHAHAHHPPHRCYPADKQTLLEIKASFSGKSNLFSTWSQHTDCCKWTGVLCKKIPKTNIRRVNFLEISGSNELVGTIPSTLDKLPYLETLILRLLPNLTGPIPPVIGKLTNLKLLFLNWDDLSGPIPNFLSHLTHLKSLSLNNNRFTGSIPAYLGRLPNLEGLDLQINHLTGKIPDTFGSFHNGTALQLSYNRLSGTIPKSLGKVNFGILELSHNYLTGDASFLFGEDKTELGHLDLSDNRLAFDISKVVLPQDAITYRLTEIKLGHNQIYGRLPDWMGRVGFLAQFDVSYNHLCGPIPGKLQGFPKAVFEHNLCLCGSPLTPCKS